MSNQEISELIKQMLDIDNWRGIRDAGEIKSVEYVRYNNHIKVYWRDGYTEYHIFELIHDIEVLKKWFGEEANYRVGHYKISSPLVIKEPFDDVMKWVKPSPDWQYHFQRFCYLPIAEQLKYLNKNKKEVLCQTK